MAGTVAGGLKTAEKNKAKNPDFYRTIGAKGGQAKVPKGFATNPELARTAGARGGTISRRGKKHIVEPETRTIIARILRRFA